MAIVLATVVGSLTAFAETSLENLPVGSKLVFVGGAPVAVMPAGYYQESQSYLSMDGKANCLMVYSSTNHQQDPSTGVHNSFTIDTTTIVAGKAYEGGFAGIVPDFMDGWKVMRLDRVAFMINPEQKANDAIFGPVAVMQLQCVMAPGHAATLEEFNKRFRGVLRIDLH
jgi:hypothetical protein